MLCRYADSCVKGLIPASACTSGAILMASGPCRKQSTLSQRISFGRLIAGPLRNGATRPASDYYIIFNYAADAPRQHPRQPKRPSRPTESARRPGVGCRVLPALPAYASSDRSGTSHPTSDQRSASPASRGSARNPVIGRARSLQAFQTRLQHWPAQQEQIRIRQLLGRGVGLRAAYPARRFSTPAVWCSAHACKPTPPPLPRRLTCAFIEVVRAAHAPGSLRSGAGLRGGWRRPRIGAAGGWRPRRFPPSASRRHSALSSSRGVNRMLLISSSSNAASARASPS